MHTSESDVLENSLERIKTQMLNFCYFIKDINA